MGKFAHQLSLISTSGERWNDAMRNFGVSRWRRVSADLSITPVVQHDFKYSILRGNIRCNCPTLETSPAAVRLSSRSGAGRHRSAAFYSWRCSCYIVVSACSAFKLPHLNGWWLNLMSKPLFSLESVLVQCPTPLFFFFFYYINLADFPKDVSGVLM